MAAALRRLKDSRHGGALAVVGEIVSQLMGCEEYVLLSLGEDGMRFVPVLSMGLSSERLEPLRVPQGILGQVAQHGVPYVLGRTSSIGASAHEAGLTACIPLLSGRQVRGVLALFRMLPQKRGLDDEDLQLLDLLSTEGAAAVSDRQPAPVLPSPPVIPAAPVAEPVGLRALYLEPGGVVAVARPTEVTTILGSCVSVCLWDEQQQVGGMNHFLLPSAPHGQPASNRHGDVAIPMLLRELERLGGQRQHMRAKIFGGGLMIGPPQPGARPSLGQRNAELARGLLAELGIPIVAEDLGGRSGRKLRFHTHDGSAWTKTLGGG
ncbi:MAG: GAF domain-containing protein [Hyalangium sp.]|uniref:GAF domain-containing protein n=1 Tax=Hyalangium sp. TaxID=2028555 RepID=UPI00389A54D6